MNVFAVSRHPRICARALDDKRLNKMILETTQIICTVINEGEGSQVTPYRSCHVNHQITKWAADRNKSAERLRWLYALGIAYGEEIIARGKSKHSCHLILEGLTFRWAFLTLKKPRLKEEDFYNGARHKGLGLDFTDLPTFEAYKRYLNARWPGDKRKPVWTKRNPPRWAEL